jgi:hypothetical protein
MSDEGLQALSEEAAAEVKQKAVELVTKDVDINHTCAALIASRQLYALGRYNLHQELLVKAPEHTDLVEEWLVGSTTSKADQAFRRDDLLKMYEMVVLPYLAKDCAKELANEKVQEQREEARRERIAGKSAVPCTFIDTGKDECYPLERADTLVLVGTLAQIELELTSIAAGLSYLDRDTGVTYSAIYLENYPEDKQFLVSARNTVNVLKKPMSFWQGLARSKAKMTKSLEIQRRFLKGNRCDLVLVDNAAELGAVGELQAAVKRLRYWCDEQKAALIVGIPLELAEEAETLGKYYKVVKLDGSQRLDFCRIQDVIAERLRAMGAGVPAEQECDESGDGSGASGGEAGGVPDSGSEDSLLREAG